MSDMYKNDVGNRIRVTTNEDLTLSTIVQFHFRKPESFEELIVSAVIEDTLNGIVYYDFTTGDLDEAGMWYFHVYAKFSGGDEFYSDADSFQVKDKYEE